MGWPEAHPFSTKEGLPAWAPGTPTSSLWRALLKDSSCYQASVQGAVTRRYGTVVPRKPRRDLPSLISLSHNSSPCPELSVPLHPGHCSAALPRPGVRVAQVTHASEHCGTSQLQK